MGIVNGRRHELGRLVHGIAEHDALVARALVLVLARIDALGNVGRLTVEKVRHLAGRVVELVLFIADIPDALPRDVGDAPHEIVEFLGCRQADFSADDHTVGRREGLTGDTGFGFLGEEGVENGVRNPVADLVGVALGDRLRGERIVLAGHEKRSIGVTPSRQEAVVTVGCDSICGRSAGVNAKVCGRPRRPRALPA